MGIIYCKVKDFTSGILQKNQQYLSDLFAVSGQKARESSMPLKLKIKCGRNKIGEFPEGKFARLNSKRADLHNYSSVHVIYYTPIIQKINHSYKIK